MKEKIFTLCGLVLIFWSVYVAFTQHGPKVLVPVVSPAINVVTKPTAIVYTNESFGFKIALPDSWAGYSVVLGSKEVRDVSTNKVVSVAETVSIRHPLWTKEIPRQDIPVDVYTLSEWAGITAEKYSVGAAPIPPSELGRNSEYVFALPARYNFAYPVGFEEVEKILENHPLQTFDTINK